MDYVAKNALPGQDSKKLADDAGKLYDELRKSQAPEPSNNPAPGTLDPRISNLIGIPSQ
jgi:hypothetical protein